MSRYVKLPPIAERACSECGHKTPEPSGVCFPCRVKLEASKAGVKLSDEKAPAPPRQEHALRALELLGAHPDYRRASRGMDARVLLLALLLEHGNLPRAHAAERAGLVSRGRASRTFARAQRDLEELGLVHRVPTDDGRVVLAAESPGGHAVSPWGHGVSPQGHGVSLARGLSVPALSGSLSCRPSSANAEASVRTGTDALLSEGTGARARGGETASPEGHAVSLVLAEALKSEPDASVRAKIAEAIRELAALERARLGERETTAPKEAEPDVAVVPELVASSAAEVVPARARPGPGSARSSEEAPTVSEFKLWGSKLTGDSEQAEVEELLREFCKTSNAAIRASGHTGRAQEFNPRRFVDQAQHRPYEFVRKTTASLLLKHARGYLVVKPAALFWKLVSGQGRQEDGCDANLVEVRRRCAELEAARRGRKASVNAKPEPGPFATTIQVADLSPDERARHNAALKASSGKLAW